MPKETTHTLKGNYRRCALCNSDSTRIVCLKAGLKKGEPRDVTNVICRRCGLIYNNPAPSDADMRAHYEGAFVADQIGLSEKSDKRRYENFIGTLESEKAKRNISLLVSFAEPFLKKHPRVLDIGCGQGMVLSEIKRRFPTAYTVGVEPDATLSRVGRKHYKLENLEQGFFEDYFKKHSGGKFDFIIMTHLLEHIAHPNRFLKQIKRLLENDGYVFIVLPNAARFPASRTLARNFVFGHLFTYTPFTLNLLLWKHGMKIVRIGEGHVRALHVVATRIENPTPAVPAPYFALWSDYRKVEKRLRRHWLYHLSFRFKRKMRRLLLIPKKLFQ